MDKIERAALERLISHAKGDTSQSRCVADYLLAWWNAGQFGGFDLTDLWSVDDAIASDMKTVFGLIARKKDYPDSLGYKQDFISIAKAWRQK